MNNDKETLADCFNSAVTGLLKLLSHAVKDAESVAPLAADVECGKAGLFFEVSIHQSQTVISGAVAYPDGRKIPCFEDTIKAPQSSGTVH